MRRSLGSTRNGERAAAFTTTFGETPDIRFEQMDARHLAFPDDSFDTACVSNSLHHFANPGPVLAEMLRVVRRGGHLVVNEMYRDGQSETQATHILLHHWWASVNRIRGEMHRERSSGRRSSGAWASRICASSISRTPTRIPMTSGRRR